MKRPVRPLAILLAVGLVAPPPALAADTSNRAVAVGAARWLRSVAIRTPAGMKWPADPGDLRSANHSLFSGTAGFVIFFLEAAQVTGDHSYLKDARAGADELLAAVEHNTEKESGLYSGLAGVGFALHEAHRATRQEKYRRGVLQVVQGLQKRARAAGAGVEWNDYTDVVLGNAGIGLFLLYAARELKLTEARALAERAGARLVELGRPAGGGLKWTMRRSTGEQMPNFAHGAAGVSYFLATLYLETKRREFLDAALAGARYLQSIAVTEGHGCLVRHREETPGIFHLSWAHGPAGTARLFYRLYQVTGDTKWMDWVRRSARAILHSGAPEKHSAGFWNNEGYIYGTAGITDFFLDLHRHTREREHLDFARRTAAHLIAKAAKDQASGGVQWMHAGSSAYRQRLTAPTGLMPGAAGIARVLLRLDAFDRGLHGGIVFPDSPW